MHRLPFAVRHLRKIMFLLGLTLGAYATLVASVYFGQRKIIYPAPALAVEPKVDDATLESVEVPNAPRVMGLHFLAPKGAPTVLHFHGNGEQLADLISFGRALHATGVGLFVMEYPGYGIAQGTPTEKANYDAAEASIHYLEKRHGVRRGELVLQGQSLGTGIALEMARRGYGRKLILVSPYTSMVDMGKLTLPIFPNEWLVHDRYLNAEKASAVKLPSLVIHGTDDEVIPSRMGKRIAELLPNARLRLVEGGHHNDLFILEGRRLLQELKSFAYD